MSNLISLSITDNIQEVLAAKRAEGLTTDVILTRIAQSLKTGVEYKKENQQATLQARKEQQNQLIIDAICCSSSDEATSLKRKRITLIAFGALGLAIPSVLMLINPITLPLIGLVSLLYLAGALCFLFAHSIQVPTSEPKEENSPDTVYHFGPVLEFTQIEQTFTPSDFEKLELDPDIKAFINNNTLTDEQNKRLKQRFVIDERRLQEGAV